jgi:hypothetical protein
MVGHLVTENEEHGLADPLPSVVSERTDAELAQKLADALIADESSDLRSDYLREAILLGLSSADLRLVPRSAAPEDGQPQQGVDGEDGGPLFDRLMGRALFLRQWRGEIKTPELLERAAAALAQDTSAENGRVEQLEAALQEADEKLTRLSRRLLREYGVGVMDDTLADLRAVIDRNRAALQGTTV